MSVLSSDYNSEYGNLPSSPPPECIIQSSCLMPSSINLYNSTRKLNLAPILKNEVHELRNMDLKKNDKFSNPLADRFLDYLVPGKPYNPTYSEEIDEKTLEVKVIVEGMLDSLVTLNKLSAMKKVDFGDFFKDVTPDKYVYFNSQYALMTFTNISEFRRTDKRILYLARHRFDGNRYVLKTATSSMPWESKEFSGENLFGIRECQILSRINHENIIRYHASWFEQQINILQLEYMIGCTLHYAWYLTDDNPLNEQNPFSKNYMMPMSDVNEQKMMEPCARQMLKHIGSALEYLHSEKTIIHNHINARNIFASCPEDFSKADDRFIKNKQHDIVNDILCGDGEMTVFKLFDFSSAYSDEEIPALRKSHGYCIVNDNKYRNRDILSLGLVIIEAFINRDKFFSLNFKNLDIDSLYMPISGNFKLLIKQMIKNPSNFSASEVLDFLDRES